MTHTIHRYGKPEDLEEDYSIIFFSAKGVNRQGSQPKIRTFLELCIKNNAVNFGNMEAGSMVVLGKEMVIDAVKDGTTVQAVFKDQNDVVNILSELVDLDLGLSVIVQGLTHRVKECCEMAGVKPHTWNHSLGVWGKIEYLPPPEVMEVTTMCGHGLISVGIVKQIFEDVRRGKTSLSKAVQKISTPCICGMVNPIRLEKILARIMEKQAEVLGTN